MNELHCMRELDHPNIVKFLGACVKPPKLCIVMELCELSMFTAIHDRKLKFSDEQLVAMAGDVASAMAYLHSRRPIVVHRDLKSHNLLLKARPRSEGGGYTVKLCDFGLVGNKITTAGTPNYMAPELLRDKPFGKASDVYAFGMCLWEMFTREIPFDGWTPFHIRDAVLEGERPPLPRSYDCLPVIRDIVQRCWSDDPAARPTFEELERRLRSWKPAGPSAVDLVDKGGGDALDALLGM